jgi:IMP dehydrogenase/GMP reductase
MENPLALTHRSEKEVAEAPVAVKWQISKRAAKRVNIPMKL